MLEIKKGDLRVKSTIYYPMTKATAEQFITINGRVHYFAGISEVKCDEGDKFESAFGKELAETNATINMLKEYKKILIKFTKQPEWRKEKPKEEYIVEPQDNLHIDGHIHIFNNHNDNKKVKVTVEVL